MEYWDGLLKTPYYLVDETPVSYTHLDCGEKFTFHRVAPLNSGFSQKAVKTPRGIHHG